MKLQIESEEKRKKCARRKGFFQRFYFPWVSQDGPARRRKGIIFWFIFRIQLFTKQTEGTGRNGELAPDFGGNEMENGTKPEQHIRFRFKGDNSKRDFVLFKPILQEKFTKTTNHSLQTIKKVCNSAAKLYFFCCRVGEALQTLGSFSPMFSGVREQYNEELSLMNAKTKKKYSKRNNSTTKQNKGQTNKWQFSFHII